MGVKTRVYLPSVFIFTHVTRRSEVRNEVERADGGLLAEGFLAASISFIHKHIQN
jgi:hypothetical protein